MSAAEAPICGACFGTDLSLWAEARDIEYFSVPESFSYFQCRSCGALSIFPVPENRLGAIYPSNYYSFAAQSQSFAEKIKEQLDRRIFSSLFREIGGDNPDRDFSALDVGGGTGWLLERARRAEPRLKRTVIVDLDEKAGEGARKSGHEYYQGRIEDYDTTEKFDLIVMLNLIEHVRDPVGVLKKTRSILATGGRILIKTPNYDSLDARIFRHRSWAGLHCPRHWVLFTPESFRSAAVRAGLTIQQLKLTQGAPFWSCSMLNELNRLGWAKVDRERPAWRHPLYPVFILMFSAFDFARLPFMRASQMFAVLAN